VDEPCEGIFVCAVVPLAPTSNNRAATRAPVMSLMVYLHNFALAGRVGDLQLKCKTSGQVQRLPRLPPR
ncbi:MAG TPA: hypothetical protein VMR94_02980, partial [Hyphomicrobiaceae bacterium]|nr:hypothetical protein [Hyphomicrobiaceae bacterium]